MLLEETATDQSLEVGAMAIPREARLLLDQIAEEVVDGLLMVGQPEFSEPVAGTSRFAEEFAARGPRDQAGNSLREFDLQKRLFRYPCSYLIYTKSFDALPEHLHAPIGVRLRAVLESRDVRDKYQHLSAPKRQAIHAILVATKSTLFDVPEDES